MSNYTSELNTAQNVFSFQDHAPIPQPEPEESLILMLEDILKSAREGSLVAFDGVGFLANGDRITCRGPEYNNKCEMLGALEVLKIQIIQEMFNDE